jgi:serine/threonine protein kinase/Tfp pilus assembly protein PilF
MFEPGLKNCTASSRRSEMGLAPGTRLGAYEVGALLGAGGMGEVYRARDPRLNRLIAIKLLPEPLAADDERRLRFKREAQSLAALNHPNIVTIHSVEQADGRLFLTMECVEGKPLSDLIAHGGMPLDRLLALAIPIADAVSAAHRKGITHRDLKPANVMVTDDQRMKLLDFGLATLVEFEPAARLATDLPTAVLSGTGHIVGTVAYMSPEQAEGRRVDARSDFFSFGVMLYELATGERPFKGDTAVSVLSSILKDTPCAVTELRPDLPQELSRIIKRCLVKDPEYRYQSAKDMRNELRDLQHASDRGDRETPPADQSSVAVLPFANLSADPDNQYFSDGLAEELINALTRVPGLRVASRTSTFRFRGGDVDIRRVARDLQVATVVEGSVRRAGTRLRVTAQLANAADGYHLWSERYDREMADVFTMQDEIVRAIVAAIAPALTSVVRKAVRRQTENLEAYELYLRGRHHWHLRTPSAMQVAQELFQQVIERDPNYAPAYAGLADCFTIRRAYGWIPAAISRARAREAVTRAIALDPTLPDVHLAEASYTLYFEPRWRGAEAPLRRAIAINPRFAGAQAYLGLVLATDDRSADALVHAKRAVETEPFSAYIHYLSALTHFLSGSFEEAERAARRVLELHPDALPGLFTLGISLTRLERYEESIGVLERTVLLSRAPSYMGMLGLALARGGRPEETRRLIGEFEDRANRGEYITPWARLAAYVGLNDRAAIRRTLEECIADTAPYYNVKVYMGMFLDPSRTDPDIADLYARLRDGVLGP